MGLQPPQPVDALQCFTQLSENIPAWITRVTELASHTAAKHAEFTAEYAKLSKGGEIGPRRRRNSSLHTHRPEEEEVGPAQPKESPGSTHSNAGYASKDPLTLKRLSRQHSQDKVNRKKRSQDDVTSATSDNENERIGRARQQLVIRYDSHSQSVLEKLVRDIGGARNNLRKGRMSQMVKMSFNRRPLPGLAPDEADLMIKPPYRGLRTSNLDLKMAAGNRISDGKPAPCPFETTDKHLELAQGLCETAAHQFLRNGDCSEGLDTAKTKLASALDLAKLEIERLGAEAENKEESEDEMVVDEKPEAKPLTAHLKSKPSFKPSEPIGIIEVDDASSGSSISIDIAAFRTSRFRA